MYRARSVMPTPSPTPFATMPFQPTFAVDAFHGMVRLSGGSTFDYEDTNYWLGITYSSALPVLLTILFIPLYWMFLCCRGGWWAKCCCFCNYGWTKLCFSVCSCCKPCCENKDGNEKSCNIQREIFPQKPRLAKAVLAIMFGALGGTNIYIITAGESLLGGIRNTASLLSDLGHEFVVLQTYAMDLNASAEIIVSNANNMGCANGTSSEVAEDAVVSMGGVLRSASLSILELLDGLPERLDDWKYEVRDRGIFYVNMGTIAMTSLGLTYSAIGLLGTLCIELPKYGLCGRCSTSLLAIANILALPLLLIFAIMMMVELTIGFPLADFCAAGPSNTLVSGLEDVFGISSTITTTFAYYTQCSGTNPFQSYYDQSVTAADNITGILDEFKNLFISTDLCCGNSSLVEASSPVSELTVSCDFYPSSAKASAVGCFLRGNYCNYDSGNNNGVCVDGGRCSNSSYTAIVNQVDYVAAEADGPLNMFYIAFGCAKMNPLFVKLLNIIMCTDLTEALYYLVGSHGATLAMMALCMLFSSFMRQTLWLSSPGVDKYREGYNAGSGADNSGLSYDAGSNDSGLTGWGNKLGDDGSAHALEGSTEMTKLGHPQV